MYIIHSSEQASQVLRLEVIGFLVELALLDKLTFG